MAKDTSTAAAPPPEHVIVPTPVQVGTVRVGGGGPLCIIAGPCVVEGEAITRRIAARLVDICGHLGLPLIFKASFDKANRTSGSGFRGIGMGDALDILAGIGAEFHLPITTDVHLPDQAEAVAARVDLLQIPAFLCRQTDLLEACAATGKPVNLKKGQFLSPWELKPALEKLKAAGAVGILQTERGTSFGYQNLVVDFRSFQVLRAHGVPVVFDATHSVQLPGASGGKSGGQRTYIPGLVRAAVAAGIDALFLEVHEDPTVALSDGPNMVPLDALQALLTQARDLHACAQTLPPLVLHNDPSSA